MTTSNRSRAAALCSGSNDTTKPWAPRRRASSALSGERLTTVVSAPSATASLTARWPRPPSPATATRVRGPTPRARNGSQTVIPAQSSGAAPQARRQRIGEPVAYDVLAGEGPQGGRSVVPVGAAVGQGREGAAEVLLAGPAHGALVARVDDVAHRHLVADGEAGDLGPGRGHHARELMPRNQRGVRRAVPAVDGVQIGMADAAVVHADREVVGAQVAPFQRRPPQRPRGACRLPSRGGPHTDSSQTDWLVYFSVEADRGPGKPTVLFGSVRA